MNFPPFIPAKAGTQAFLGDYVFEKFRQLAGDLECDEDEARFDERFKKVATAPKPAQKPSK